MAADQKPRTAPDPDVPAAQAATPAADPAELTDAQLDAVAGGVGAMQMAGGMQMMKGGSIRSMGEIVSSGDPHVNIVGGE